jgi:ketosteroid isomerase-like protein
VTRATVHDHLAAFNAHDSGRLLQGIADDVVWATGRDTLVGRDEVSELFDDWLWAMEPRFDVRRLIVSGDTAAAELIEHVTIDGAATSFAIAVFFTVRAGQLAAVKVFREGSADLPTRVGS